jgi:hypothetical protein
VESRSCGAIHRDRRIAHPFERHSLRCNRESARQPDNELDDLRQPDDVVATSIAGDDPAWAQRIIDEDLQRFPTHAGALAFRRR